MNEYAVPLRYRRWRKCANESTSRLFLSNVGEEEREEEPGGHEEEEQEVLDLNIPESVDSLCKIEVRYIS